MTPPRFTLTLQNRQHTRRVNTRLLRQLLKALLLNSRLGYEQVQLGIFLVSAREMQHVNETYLRHQGSTDVITFDYNDPAEPATVCGELFICVDEALIQARRFHVSPQSELVRYAVHGLLHLCNYDDLAPSPRRRMKRQENRLLRALQKDFPLDALFLSPLSRATTLRA